MTESFYVLNSYLSYIILISFMLYRLFCVISAHPYVIPLSFMSFLYLISFLPFFMSFLYLYVIPVSLCHSCESRNPYLYSPSYTHTFVSANQRRDTIIRAYYKVPLLLWIPHQVRNDIRRSTKSDRGEKRIEIIHLFILKFISTQNTSLSI